MSICKSLFTLAPVTLVLLASVGSANAANNATLTVTANVVAATCDVSLSQETLDLGNYAPAQFAAVLTPIASSKKNFSVGLSNCDAPLVANDTANVVISGQTLAGNPNLFNSSTDGSANAGIMLNQVGLPTTYINNEAKLEVAKATTPAAGDFNTKTLSLQAGLASTVLTPAIGKVKAPILFSFTYN